MTVVVEVLPALRRLLRSAAGVIGLLLVLVLCVAIVVRLAGVGNISGPLVFIATGGLVFALSTGVELGDWKADLARVGGALVTVAGAIALVLSPF